MTNQSFSFTASNSNPTSSGQAFPYGKNFPEAGSLTPVAGKLAVYDGTIPSGGTSFAFQSTTAPDSSLAWRGGNPTDVYGYAYYLAGSRYVGEATFVYNTYVETNQWDSSTAPTDVGSLIGLTYGDWSANSQTAYPSFCKDFKPHAASLFTPWYQYGAGDWNTYSSSNFGYITEFSCLAYLTSSSDGVEVAIKFSNALTPVYSVIMDADSSITGSWQTISASLDFSVPGTCSVSTTIGSTTTTSTITYTGDINVGYSTLCKIYTGTQDSYIKDIAMSGFLTDVNFAGPTVPFAPMSDPCAISSNITLQHNPWVQPLEVDGAKSSLHVYKNDEFVEDSSYVISGNVLNLLGDAVPSSGDKIEVKYFYDPSDTLDNEAPKKVDWQFIQDLTGTVGSTDPYSTWSDSIFDITQIFNGKWQYSWSWFAWFARSGDLVEGNSSISGTNIGRIKWTGSKFIVNHTDIPQAIIDTLPRNLAGYWSPGKVLFLDVPTNHGGSGDFADYNYVDSVIHIVVVNSQGHQVLTDTKAMTDIVPEFSHPQIFPNHLEEKLYVFDCPFNRNFSSFKTNAALAAGPYPCAVFDYSSGKLIRTGTINTPFLTPGRAAGFASQWSQYPGVLPMWNPAYAGNSLSSWTTNSFWDTRVGREADRLTADILSWYVNAPFLADDYISYYSFSGPTNIGGVAYPGGASGATVYRRYEIENAAAVVKDESIVTLPSDFPVSELGLKVRGSIHTSNDSFNVLPGDKARGIMMSEPDAHGQTWYYIPDLNIYTSAAGLTYGLSRNGLIYKVNNDIYLINQDSQLYKAIYV